MNGVKPQTLYIVGTPIGNLGDLPPRAAQTLEQVDFIAAEDTRVTRKLLAHLGLHTPLISYHEHNRRESGEVIIRRLLDGQCAALVTDAGMPCVSDPGQELVSLCAQAGLTVEVVPGPSAVVCAVALSGLPSGRFCFEGFLSTARQRRRQHLEQIKNEPRTMVFYEAPHKLLATLTDLLAALGDRKLVLSREMTKLHEETLRTTLSGAVELYQNRTPRGEFVLVISGAEPEAPPDSAQDAVELAESYVAGGLSVRDAARHAAQETGASRSALYKELLIKRET